MKNSGKNFDLLAMTSEIVNNSMTSKSSRKSMNDYLLETLLDIKKPLTKAEVVAIIALARMLDKNSQEYYNSLSEAEVRKIMTAEIKTTSNGFDTATCNGKTNSSFSFNKDYSKYTLIKHTNKTYEIKSK